MDILQQFDQLMDHLNGEDTSMAEAFRIRLELVAGEAEKFDLLLNAGVDNWVGYSEALYGEDNE